MSRKKEEIQEEKKNPNLVSYGEYKSRYGSGNLMSYDRYRDWYGQQQMKRRSEQARYNSYVEQYRQQHPTVTTPKYTYTTPERKDYGTDKTGNSRLHQRPGSLGLIADAGVSDMPTVKPAQVQENDPEDLKGRLQYLANYGIPIMQERGENGSTRNVLAETPDERNSPSMYIKERPKDYWTGNNRTDYDRWMYDSIYGSGAYDRKIGEELETDEEYDQFDKSLDRMWHSLKYGGIDKLFEPEQEQTDEEEKLFWDEMYRNQNGKLYGKGNIDLNDRQVVNNPDGSYSTELSTTVGYDDGVYLIPTVVDGKIVSTDEAIKHFEETGEYLGKFDNEEDAQDYAQKLHQRQEERYKYAGYSGDYTFGGKERPLSQSEIYDIAEKDKKGETADELLNYENWNNYLNTNPYTKWDNLEEDKRHWDFVQGSSGRKLEELGETGQDMLDQWDAEYSDPMLDKMITELPALITVPADYEQRKEYYDRMLYDWAMGEDGWYDNDAGDPIREERLEELWEPIRSGKVEKIARINQGYDQYVEDYNDYSAWNREAGRQLEQINYQEGLKESYDALIDQYNDNITDPNFMPEYDKGTTNPNNIRVEIVSNNQTNNIDRIASFIGGGNEFKSWADAVFKDGEPKVTPFYNYAMMLLDGYDENGVYHADRDEKSIFLNLYNQAKKEGRDPKEARAFLDGMQQVLRDRYSEAESIQISEVARKYPVAASLVDLYFRQINAGADVVRHIAGAVGDESVKDPNSGYYTGARFNEKTEQTIMNNLGPVWGKAYQSIMESASNLIRALTTAGAPSRLVQTIESLGQMWLQVDLEATRRNIDKVGYEKASALGALDATSEVIEELMPFEVMLGSGKYGTLVSMAINSATEGLEELFGATVLEKLKGTITGDDSEQARSDQIYTEKGYVNGKGEWIDLSNIKDKNALKEIADFQARKEFISNVLESTAGGIMGGWLGGTYGEINRVANTIKTGKKITSKTNTINGQTGSNQLISAAAGMEGTESQKMAENLQASISKGKKPNNYQIGKLAAKMAEEVGDRYGEIVEETIRNRVKAQLTELGVNPTTASGAAKAIAKNLTKGEMTREDRKKISQDERAVELWKTYNSATAEGAEARADLAGEVEENTKDVRSVAGVIGDLTGRTAKGDSAVSDEVDRSNRESKSNAEAVDNLHERRGELISDEYAETAKGLLESNKGLQQSKTFLDDIMKIRLAVMSRNPVMPKTNLDEETARKLWDAATQEREKNEQKRILNQWKVMPGKGKTVFYAEADAESGAEYGTGGWTEMVNNSKSLSNKTKRQMRMIAEVSRRLGMNVRIINDARVIKGSRRDQIFGWEDDSGTITINIAGRENNGLSHHMMTTLSHEMTHWLEQNSREGYAQLRQFVVDHLRQQGVDVEKRMVDLINNEYSVLKGTGVTMNLDRAMKEIVAQGCEELLTSKTMRDALAQQNPTLYRQVRSYVQKFIRRLDEAIRGMEDSSSMEARTVREWREQIAELWLKAYDEALNREERGLQQDLEASDGTETHYGDTVSYSVRVTNPEELRFLNNQKTITTYKSMQLIDGKLYPPMAAVVSGSMEDYSELGKWEKAVEHPELIKKGNKFTLNKGKGKGSLDAAYNPYMHSSNLMINDQFSGAYGRPNLVTVECKVPESELTSGYHAEHAKDSVGWHGWHTGPVASKMRQASGKERQVMLSRWIKPVRIVPDSEVAKHYADLLKGTDIAVPDNVVTPSLKNELIKAGVKISESGKVKEESVQYSVVQLSNGTKIAVEDENVLKNKPEGVSRLKYISDYLKDHIGEKEFVEATSDVVYLGKALPGEYVSSDYTKALIKGHSNNLEVKNRAAGFLLDAIAAADSKTGPENVRHDNKNARYGVYRFTTRIAIPVKNREGEIKNYNVYKVQLLVNHTGKKTLELYDMMDITKDNAAGNMLKEESANGSLKVIRYPAVVSDNNLTQREKKNKDIMDKWEEMKKNSSFSVAQMDNSYNAMDAEYMDAVNSGDVEQQEMLVMQAAELAGYNIEGYHGTDADFTEFKIGDIGYHIGSIDQAQSRMNQAGMRSTQANRTNKIMHLVAKLNNPLVIDHDFGDWHGKNVAEMLLETEQWEEGFDENAEEINARLRKIAAMPDGRYTDRVLREFLQSLGYDGIDYENQFEDVDRDGYGWAEDFDRSYILFDSKQLKSADPVTYDDDGNVIPLSERFNPNEGDIRFSVAQLAQANGMRFDEDAVQLYNKKGQLIDGVRVKVTEDMIENTPIGMLINMARDGVTTKKGKVKFKATISAETAQKQKKMFTDLMNMIARYKDSNLVWEIAGSQLYSALKSNSDPQYSTTVDFGTVCAKTQEIINVMSRVMLEKGRGLTREEVLMVYNETANAGLTVPCPVCYVFSRWMGVPSLLNQMSQYQKRFVVLKKDGSIDVKKTQEAARKYIQDAMDKYGSKAELDKAKTSIMNRMKTQEKNRTDALLVLNSKEATAEAKRAAKTKHDDAIKQLDALTKDLGEVEAYNWVTQALCKETSKGSGKYVVDPEFELTPDNILFDLRRTGDFAKYTKNWRYRNTRGAGMGKAIMPYSGITIGDIIYGTERKTEIKNALLQMKAGGASNAIKNAIIRARKQNLIGGQRLQSTSDFRPEWGLDYLMTFLELQAIGSKVQMYTKVAEAVDLLASMGADINLSIMGKGSGFHIATAEEIRESRRNTKRGRDLRSRMGKTTDENGVEHTYILDFSDVTGMDYDTAKALKNKHHSVQAILVGMNDIHIRLAMENPDIDFIIPWHSSGNSQDALKSMIASVGEKLETSSDYTDTQADKPSENQTAEQKQLWDLRMKILQGKALTAAEKKIVDNDDILGGLWERFNVEGIDPDCYQVELGAAQAGQIFPYEYWDKGLMKADARANGTRFIEYCQHFGITPRFSGTVKHNEDGTFTVTGNFAGAVYDEKGNITGYKPELMQNGYWKVLIDRPMYDNNGKYREQQVVDVTKAKVGSLDAEGNLQDSDMPLKTSAMYGSEYSEQEKNATDNTLAALDMKAKMEAIGSNVLEENEEETPAPRNNQSTFGAAARTPIMKTRAEDKAVAYYPPKQRAMYADDGDGISRSVALPDMDVRRFMLGLNESSLSTVQERTMLRQFKELDKALEIAQHALEDRTKKLRELEGKPNPSAFDKDQMQRLRNRIKDSEAKITKLENEMARVTSDKGYAALMARNEQVMRNLADGRTAEEVRATVEALTKNINTMTREIEMRQRRIDEMRKDVTFRKGAALIDRKAAEKMAGMIRSEYKTNIPAEDLIRALTEIKLKMVTGQSIKAETEGLAWRIVTSIKGEGSVILDELRGSTIVLGKGMQAELKASGRTLADIRKDLAGTGIKIRFGNENTLDEVWDQMCDMITTLNRDAQEGNMLDELLKAIRNEKKKLVGGTEYEQSIDEVIEEIKATAAAIGTNAPKDPGAMKILDQMNKLINEMAENTEKVSEELQRTRKQLAYLVDQGKMAMDMTDSMQGDIAKTIQYNNLLAEQSEAALWKSEKWKLIEQLKSEHTQALLEEQAKWKARIEKDQQARQMMMTNQQLRKAVHLNVTRLWKLLANETDQKNIPEHMKGLAREMIGMIVGNDLNGRKISGIDRKDLMEMIRVLDIMERQDGKFTPDDLRLITDEEAQDVVMEALADLEDGIKFYNASTSGNIITNLQAFHNALDRISDAVAAITNVIRAESEISIGERKVLIQDAAGYIIQDMGRSRFKGELKGFGARQLKWAKNSVVYGNTTPVFFFKNLRNRGMTEQWEELKRGQNRNGLETEKAKRFLQDLGERTHYQTWADQKHTVKIGSRNVEMTVGNMMELYAIWKREMLNGKENPQYSFHLRNGGIIIQQQESTDGKLRREHQNTRPMRVTDQDVGVMYDMLTDEQKQYLDEMVKYLSSDMSDLGNEASMRMYGIKKYKEDWYFPMKVWDGVKSARSDRGISGTNDNRAAHKGWSKRRVNKAQNALVIGDFTQDAVGHIVEMINYNTMAPAIENINKILNYQQTELDDNGEDIKGVKRNVRVMFGEAYGQQALNYLETFLKDLNGGVVQDQRSTLRDKLISVFRKNAVAGSLSVALQQPLSYIRAAMMINPKYLAQAINPTYWKGSHEEMTKYSGVAVIKDMGRFDMNFGASAKEYIAPEKKGTNYEKVSNALTVLPELMDRMTWTRMWSAVKLEQHQLHPEMDIKDEAFLKIVAERFNDVMMQTQVYDSVLVRSQNMRSDKLSLKMLTSFMAEPTLSLNILSDAVLNFREKGGKATVAKAAATFSLAAVMQAFFKGLMGSGRSPDEKKTWLENFLSKWQQNFISEINPISLVPGYGDLIELLKNGELKDDAMGVIGKITTAINTIRDTVSGKKEFGYRTIEDTAAQIAQLFTNIPYKNILRDLRAMYNYISQEPYAKRGTSGAVLREQAKANRYSADNLLGVLNTFLGEAGFKTSNAAYYGRLFNAMQNGNQAEVSDIREYLMLIKGQDEKKIASGLSAQAKNRLNPAEASQWAIDNDMMDSSSTLTTQYKKDQITREEYKKLLKQQDPNLTENDIWWKIDRVDYQKETGAEKVSGYGYRLKDAINNNKAAEISRAVNDMMKHGIPKEKIKKDYLSDWKKAYLEADSNGRRKIRDALQKACKAAGYTAADADAMIAKWEKEKNK